MPATKWYVIEDQFCCVISRTPAKIREGEPWPINHGPFQTRREAERLMDTIQYDTIEASEEFEYVAG